MIKTVMNMSEKEIKQAALLECAQKGIKIPIEPRYKEVPDIKVEPTIDAYGVGEHWFSCMEDAKEMLDRMISLKAKTSDYDYNVGYNFRFLKELENTDIKHQRFYDKDLLEKQATDLKEAKKLKEENDRLKSEYNAAQREYEQVVQPYYDAYAEAQRIRNTIEDYKVQMDGYIELVNDHRMEAPIETALQFFYRAYPFFEAAVDHPENDAEEVTKQLWDEYLEEIMEV